MIHSIDKKTVTRRQRTTEPEKPDRKKQTATAPMDATTRIIDDYLRNTKTASIELLVYSRHCILTEEKKPTFRGMMKALHAIGIEYNGVIIYENGDYADFSILDKTVYGQMFVHFVWLRRRPSRIGKLTRRERKHLQNRCLSFDPKPVKKKKT